jgi:hypothetical protein
MKATKGKAGAASREAPPLRVGFDKRDITPRVGVELSGFGPFVMRRSIGIRDRLWARAVAIEQAGRTLVLISCDLIGVPATMTGRIRAILTARAGLPAEAVMVHCTHTHSGPGTAEYIGWGAPDEPYLETLPRRIAEAALAALGNLQPAVWSHAEVPCEGVGLNRQYDRDAPPLDDVLRDDWRPARPELTDTTCHVLRAEAGGRMIGFISYFGCHPVVCCQETRYLHGDYCGVATNLLEREHPGAVGLFLQGAEGDVNSCVVHKPEVESMLALDVIAGRYARAVRRGLRDAQALRVETLAALSRRIRFSRRPLGVAEVRALLAAQQAILDSPGLTEQDPALRMAAVYAIALRRVVATLEAGGDLAPPTEVQGFRLGPLLLLASPFETFQAIKNDVRAGTGVPLTLVLSVTNDAAGYAPDRTTAAAGGYAADQVPMIIGTLPYARIHDELVEALLGLAAGLGGEGRPA